MADPTDPSTVQDDSVVNSNGDTAQELAYRVWRDRALKKLQGYAQQLNMTPAQLVASQDPSIMQHIANGEQLAGQQGLSANQGPGGLSAANSQNIAMNTANKYAISRATAGAQAQNQVTQGANEAYEGEVARSQWAQSLALQKQNAAFAAQMAAQQMQSSAVGSLTSAGGQILGKSTAITGRGLGGSSSYSPSATPGGTDWSDYPTPSGDVSAYDATGAGSGVLDATAGAGDVGPVLLDTAEALA